MTGVQTCALPIYEGVVSGELLADLLLRHVEVSAPVDHVRNLFPVGHVAVVSDQALEQRLVLADGAGSDQRIDLVAELAHQALLDGAGTLAGNTVVGRHRTVGRG